MAERNFAPLPIGSRITSYTVRGRWPDGDEIADPHDDEAAALDAARMSEQGGALVYVERRIERIVAEVESVEMIYGQQPEWPPPHRG